LGRPEFWAERESAFPNQGWRKAGRAFEMNRSSDDQRNSSLDILRRSGHATTQVDAVITRPQDASLARRARPSPEDRTGCRASPVIPQLHRLSDGFHRGSKFAVPALKLGGLAGAVRDNERRVWSVEVPYWAQRSDRCVVKRDVRVARRQPHRRQIVHAAAMSAGNPQAGTSLRSH
jgi:hypothetical protein